MAKEPKWTEDILLVREVLNNHRPKEKTPEPGKKVPIFICNFCRADWPCENYSTANNAKKINEELRIKQRNDRIKPTPNPQTGTIPERHTFKGGENIANTGI